MFSRLALPLRVLPRTFGVGLRPSLVARQQRTFLTTAYVAEPAAKEGTTTATKKAAPKTAGKKKAAAKKPTKAKAKAKAKAKPKKKAADPDDPNTRFKNGLLAVKLKSSERPPLKSKTAFNIFVQEQYKLNGSVGNREGFFDRARELGARWKAMSEAEKQPYEDKAAAAAVEFNKAREEYFTTVDPRVVRAWNAQRRAKGKLAVHSPPGLLPKKPFTPYIRFFMDVYKTVDIPDDITVPQQRVVFRSKKVGEMWQALSAEEKEQYSSAEAK